MLAKRFGLTDEFATSEIDALADGRDAVGSLVRSSFLAESAKVDYIKRFDDRLKALTNMD